MGGGGACKGENAERIMLFNIFRKCPKDIWLLFKGSITRTKQKCSKFVNISAMFTYLRPQHSIIKLTCTSKKSRKNVIILDYDKR